MSTMTAETIFPLIAQLSPPEQQKLRRLLDQQEEQAQQSAKPPRDKRLPSKPLPSGGMEA
jgi:hypothetical protein